MPSPLPAVARVTAWAVEGVRTAPAGLRVALPCAPLPAALREEVAARVAAARGAPWSAWTHDEWRSFHGPGHDDDVRATVLAHADQCAREGRPVGDGALVDVLPPAARREVRAVVVRVGAEAAAERRLVRACDRVRGAGNWLSPATVADLVVAALAAPVVAPSVLSGAVLGALARLAPPMPEVRGGDATLLTRVLADAVPALLGHAVVRAVVLASPVPVVVGVREGLSAATLRLGRDGASVVDGIDAGALVVLDGEIEMLLRLATGKIVREAGGVPVGPA